MNIVSHVQTVHGDKNIFKNVIHKMHSHIFLSKQCILINFFVIFSPQRVLFSPMVSKWASGWAGGRKKFVSGLYLRNRKV